MSDEEITQSESVSEETQTVENETKKSSFSDFIAAIKCMISFFTIIRLDVGQKEFDAMERNFWLVPVLGFINGLLALVVCMVLGFCGVSLLGQAVAALGSMYIFSKFLHFDGLTDFGDGMVVSSESQEKHVRALKDSLIGAGGFGVALIVVLFTIAMYYEIGSDAFSYIVDDNVIVKIYGIGMVAFCVEILVKNAQVAAATFGNPGNGMASRQVSNTTVTSLILSTVLTVVLLAIATGIGVLIGHSMDYYADIETAGFVVLFIISVIMSIVVGYFMARTANKSFGFVNGDILGATNEISRAIILLIAVLIFGLM